MQSKDPYVLGIVQGVRPEQQRRVLQQEIERITRESEAQHSEINQRRAEGYRDDHPKIQGRLHLIRGTDAELRRNGGKPREGSYNDRVLRIQTALQEPVLPDTLPYMNRLFGRDVLGGAPRPARPQTQAKVPKLTTTNDVLNGLMGRDVLNTRIPNVPRVREEDIEGPNVAQLEPSIGFMQRFALPLGLSGWNASPEEMQETWEVWKQQARAGKVALPPKTTGANDERMFAQVRDLSSKFYHEVIEPRSRQRYPGTTYNVPGIAKVKGPLLPTSPEAFEAYQDPELTELYERFPEWLQARSKQRLPRQVIQYAIALKDLAKIQRRRAGRLAVSALTDIGVQAGSAALDFPSAGVPGKSQLGTKLAAQLPRQGSQLPRSTAAQAVSRTIGPWALTERYLSGAGSQSITDLLTHPELSMDERWQRLHDAGVGSTITGSLLHGAGEVGGAVGNAARQTRSPHRGDAKVSVSGAADVQFSRGKESTPLEVGDWVSVASRPDLGIAQVRQISRDRVVLWPHGERKAGGAIKVRRESIQVSNPGVSSSGANGLIPEMKASNASSGLGGRDAAHAYDPHQPSHPSAVERERNDSRLGSALPSNSGGANALEHSPNAGASGKQPNSPKRVVLDLFGGERSQIPGAINVDLVAQEGVRASAGEGVYLPFKDGIADEVVASGPRTTFLAEAARVLRPGGKIYINSSVRNKYGKLSTHLRGVGSLEDLVPLFSSPSVSL